MLGDSVVPITKEAIENTLVLDALLTSCNAIIHINSKPADGALGRDDRERCTIEEERTEVSLGTAVHRVQKPRVEGHQEAHQQGGPPRLRHSPGHPGSHRRCQSMDQHHALHGRPEVPSTPHAGLVRQEERPSIWRGMGTWPAAAKRCPPRVHGISKSTGLGHSLQTHPGCDSPEHHAGTDAKGPPGHHRPPWACTPESRNPH